LGLECTTGGIHLGNVDNAIKKALEQSKDRNFKESVELAINLKDVDLSIPKNRIDEEVILPKGRGKIVKVAVIGSGELALKAKKVADLVIKPEELEELADDKKNAKKIANRYNFFIAEAPLMPTVGKRLGIFLGPRGKMPKPVPPGADPTGLINNMRKSVKIRTKANRTFHVAIGTKDMNVEDLTANANAVLKRVTSKLERGQMNINSVYVKTTMGPSERIV
jgi:large subunit ribosomal protein L1